MDILESEINEIWSWIANDRKCSVDEIKQLAKTQGIFSDVYESNAGNNIYNAVSSTIDKLVDNDINETATAQLLTALAMDSESIVILDLLMSKLSKTQLNNLIVLGLKFDYRDTRWQAIEMLMESTIPGKNVVLYNILKTEKDPYVLRVGLNFLSNLDIQLAKRIAKKNLKSDDDYLRILAQEILESL